MSLMDATQNVVSVQIYGGVEHFRNPGIVGQAALPSSVVVGQKNGNIAARTTASYFDPAVFAWISALVHQAIPALNLIQGFERDQFE